MVSGRVVKTSTFFIAEASLSNSCVIASKTPSIFLKISSSFEFAKIFIALLLKDIVTY
jgi:hypothetical protein